MGGGWYWWMVEGERSTLGSPRSITRVNWHDVGWCVVEEEELVEVVLVVVVVEGVMSAAAAAAAAAADLLALALFWRCSLRLLVFLLPVPGSIARARRRVLKRTSLSPCLPGGGRETRRLGLVTMRARGALLPAWPFLLCCVRPLLLLALLRCKGALSRVGCVP